MMEQFLKDAIDNDDVPEVQRLMLAHPGLHQAKMGYGGSGPLTWAAECRYEPPSPARLAIAEWMILHGSGVHQGGDAPLMRAALRGERIPMMELLVKHGANVNARWNGDYPIIWAACESADSIALKWLLRNGANPDTKPKTALDYLLGTYARKADLHECVQILRKGGAPTRYDLPGVLDTVADRAASLDASLIHHHYPELDCGSTAARGLLLEGGTLLHVAAEYGSYQCAAKLIEMGADVNARGKGGQTPIFHSATQYEDRGLAITELLLRSGADVSIRAKIRGHYDRPDEMLDCTVLEYAERFPNEEFPGSNRLTVDLLVMATGSR